MQKIKQHSKMKVLLAFPNSPIVSDPCSEGFNPSKMPPYELLQCAGFLRNDFAVSVIDAKAEELDFRKFCSRILDSKASAIALWSTPKTYLNDIKVLEYAKKLGIFTVLILNQAILLKQVLEKFKFIDAAVHNERPFVLKELFAAVQEKKGLAKVQGIVFRSGKNVLDNGKRSLCEYSDLPIPAYDLAPMHLYNKSSITVISSRGCPFSCSFCFYGKTKWRTRTAMQKADEVELLAKKYGYKNIGFADQHFTFYKEQTIEFCDELLRRNIRVNWFCDSRAESVDLELLKKMKSAGCERIFFGVEHINDEILKRAGKSQTKETIIKAVALAEKAKTHAVLSFIIGLPGETDATIKELMNFIVSAKPWNYHINPAIPFPGTELYEEAKKNGWLVVQDKPENFWASSDFSHPIMVVPPMTAEKLQSARKSLQLLPRLHPRILYNSLADVYSRGGVSKLLNVFSGTARILLGKESK